MRRWLGIVGLLHLIAFGVLIARPASRELADANVPEKTKAKHFYYHKARSDRSGAVIEDMLLAHAHAYASNLTYGGACAISPLKYQSSHDELIQLLGLQHVLMFACPLNVSSLEDLDDTASPTHRRFNSRIFRSDWLERIRDEHRRHRKLLPQNDEKAVLHIRRGDVSLCDPETSDRYLPNQHYVSLWSSLNTETVHVYSEQQSIPEGWDSLRSLPNIQLHLNASIIQAWSSMIQSETLILSKSSFSFVPAIFAPHKVIYTPYWANPLPGWTIVDDNLMQTTRRATIRLRHEMCGT